MDGTVLGQGSFTSTGVNQTIAVPSGIDFLDVYNFTQASATGGAGFSFYWQRGMGTQGIVNLSGAAHAVTSNVTAVGAFTLYDPSQLALGSLNNGSTGISAISTATPPVATVGSTAGMAPGSVARIINVTGAQQFGGIDFTVGYGTFSATTFSLDYAPTIAAGTAGSFYVVNFDPIFYPRRRFITAITKATSAVITLSVGHNYKVGQEVRLVVPAAYGMTQMNGLVGTITAVDIATGNTHNTITVNIDSTAFTTFAFPLTTAVPFTAAQVVPIGEDTATALNSGVDILTDATVNTAFLGMTLAAGAALPAGATNDVIYWVAGKSTYGGL